MNHKEKLKEKIKIAEEELKKVKNGKLPTKEGKKLIGKLSQLKTLYRRGY